MVILGKLKEILMICKYHDKLQLVEQRMTLTLKNLFVAQLLW